VNILHLARDFTGSPIYEQLVRHLEKWPIRQLVYIATWPKHLSFAEQYPDREKVTYHFSLPFSPWMRPLYFLKLRVMHKDLLAYLKEKETPDVIHAHSWFTEGGVALKMKQSLGIPYVVAVRNSDVYVNYKYFWYARSYALKILEHASQIVFISPACQNLVFDQIIPDSKRSELMRKVVTMPNGIDSFWFENRAKNPKKLLPNQPIQLLLTGEVCKNKNILSIIESVRILQKMGISACLDVAGREGDLHDTIRQISDQEPHLVRYHGSIKDKNRLLELYQAAHIFVMPSHMETFGLSYIEAMSQATPVIYKYGQGISGYFEEGAVGFGTDGTASDIAKKIQQIMHNYEPVSETALASINHFTWDFLAEKYHEIYRNVRC
jgi:L-malate glycosyltransferase